MLCSAKEDNSCSIQDKIKGGQEMKALVCEICSGNELVKNDGLYTCQYCGTKYTVEEVKNLMIEGTVDVKGTVKVDTSDELKNLYVLARRAKDDENHENANKYYEMILVKEPLCWEANFYSVYFKQFECTIAEIFTAGTTVTNCLETVIKLIKGSTDDVDLKRKVASEVGTRCIVLSEMLYNAAKTHHKEIAFEIRHEYDQEFCNNAISAVLLLYSYGDHLINIMGDEFGDIASASWEIGIKLHNHHDLLSKLADKELNKNTIAEYVEKIKKHNPTYNAPEINAGACYIATYIYDSYDCPQLWILRRYRDYSLQRSMIGKALIKAYYFSSPKLLKLLGGSKVFKTIFKIILERFISRLYKRGFTDTPYYDKKASGI